MGEHRVDRFPEVSIWRQAPNDDIPNVTLSLCLHPFLFLFKLLFLFL